MITEHVLIVPEVIDDGYEIEHPEGCPTYRPWGETTAPEYCCPLGSLIRNEGLDEFVSWGSLPAGRYPIRYWSHSRQNYDRVIELVDEGIEIISLPPVWTPESVTRALNLITALGKGRS